MENRRDCPYRSIGLKTRFLAFGLIGFPFCIGRLLRPLASRFPSSLCLILVRSDWETFSSLFWLGVFESLLAFQVFQSDGVEIELLLCIVGTEYETRQTAEFPRTFWHRDILSIPS